MRGERCLRVFYLKHNGVEINVLENNEREVREEGSEVDKIVNYI